MSNLLLRTRSISEIITHSFQFFGTFFKIFFTLLFFTAIPFLMFNTIVFLIANQSFSIPTDQQRYIIFIVVTLIFIIFLAVYVGLIAEFMEAYRLNSNDLSFRELKYRIRQNFRKHVVLMFILIISIYPYELDMNVDIYTAYFFLYILRVFIVLSILGISFMVIAHQRKSIFSTLKNTFKLSMNYLHRSSTVTFLLSLSLGLIVYSVMFVLLNIYSIEGFESFAFQSFDLKTILFLFVYVFIILSVLPIFFLGFFFHYYDIQERSKGENLLKKIDDI